MTEILLAIQMGQAIYGSCETLTLLFPTDTIPHPGPSNPGTGL